MKRDLPSCIIRVLYYLYTRSVVCVSWCDIVSTCFHCESEWCQTGRGVKSDIDDLMSTLSGSAGVGCYIGHHFFGALAYADDVLIAPTASAMRRLLAL